jgi:ubiquinone/menaquinone biosynthesis C-methylase UbiE
LGEFHQIQTQTGWRRVLEDFVAWCSPRRGCLALDVGCGPCLVPALLAGRGCRAFGVDLELNSFHPQPLHPVVSAADAHALPFGDRGFDLVTATNLLFMLPEPQLVLQELARVIAPGGQLALLNPSERMSLAAVEALVQERRLAGLARDSLLNWARRAEAGHRWTEPELSTLLAAAGLRPVESTLRVGPGLARFTRANPL